LYTSDHELEALVIHQINDVKRHYDLWADPDMLARALEIPVVEGKLGAGLEGAALPGIIIRDPATGVQARQRFTLYHEIVHHLIRKNDELFSILHDQYSSDEDFYRITERLCNVGAAEFVLPRDTVLAAIEASGFSILLVKELSKVNKVSSTAACVQLAQCAKHQCIAVVCRMIPNTTIDQSSLFTQTRPTKVLSVEIAISSPFTKYIIAHGSLIPKGHLLFDAYESGGEKVLRAKAPIPFRDNRRWEKECEAICLGTQVFGLFHIDPLPVKSRDQLQLPFF
jgi:hypothetical protein